MNLHLLYNVPDTTWLQALTTVNKKKPFTTVQLEPPRYLPPIITFTIRSPTILATLSLPTSLDENNALRPPQLHAHKQIKKTCIRRALTHAPHIHFLSLLRAVHFGLPLPLPLLLFQRVSLRTIDTAVHCASSPRYAATAPPRPHGSRKA